MKEEICEVKNKFQKKIRKSELLRMFEDIKRKGFIDYEAFKLIFSRSKW